MSNNPNPDIEYTMTAENGGVSSVTVSITVNAKVLGADAFVKMEESFSFTEPATAADAIIKRDEMTDVLREQIIGQATTTAEAIREAAAKTPKGAVSVHPVSPAPVLGTQSGTVAPSAGPAATMAVANGAAPSSGDWMSVPSRFGDGDIRFLPCSVYPTERLEAEVGQWLTAQGLNPSAFKVWDNRPGPRGLEAGAPNGAVAAIKIGRDAESFVPAEFAKNAVARVKFNANGSLYIWLTKEAEAAIKYGALDGVKLSA
jgi:hypothetical protein